MLFNPEVYFKDCDECKTYLMVDGKPHQTPQGVKVKRQPGEKPTCKMCDKFSVPVLSSRNWMTWEMYKRHKHFGLEDFERRDKLVQRHMIILGEIDQAANAQINPFAGMFNNG